jgi:hypothetical protein
MKCARCRLSAEAYLRTRGDMRGRTHERGEVGGRVILLSEALAAAYEGLAREAAL